MKDDLRPGVRCVWYSEDRQSVAYPIYVGPNRDGTHRVRLDGEEFDVRRADLDPLTFDGLLPPLMGGL